MVRRALIFKQSDLPFSLNSFTQESFLSVVSAIRNPSGHKTVLPTGNLKFKIGTTSSSTSAEPCILTLSEIISYFYAYISYEKSVRYILQNFCSDPKWIIKNLYFTFSIRVKLENLLLNQYRMLSRIMLGPLTWVRKGNWVSWMCKISA